MTLERLLGHHPASLTGNRCLHTLTAPQTIELDAPDLESIRLKLISHPVLRRSLPHLPPFHLLPERRAGFLHLIGFCGKDRILTTEPPEDATWLLFHLHVDTIAALYDGPALFHRPPESTTLHVTFEYHVTEPWTPLQLAAHKLGPHQAGTLQVNFRTLKNGVLVIEASAESPAADFTPLPVPPLEAA